MTRALSEVPGRGGWAYVSLISTLPGLSLAPRRALALQFLAFETPAVGLAAWYGLWDVLPVVTVAIAVSTAGSGLMVVLSDRLQSLEPPEAYRRALFDSGVDVLMGVVAFVMLVTYLLVAPPGPDRGAISGYFGGRLPAAAVAFGLLVGWDLCYRVGTAWWASITGLWRSVRYRAGFEAHARRTYRRLDLLTVGFAGLQLLLLPFVWGDRVLALAILIHVAAVVVVSSTSFVLLARGRARRSQSAAPP